MSGWASTSGRGLTAGSSLITGCSPAAFGARPACPYPVAQGPEPVHDLIGAAPEVVVQQHVLGVELIVDVRAARVRLVGARVHLAHRGRGGRDVGVGACRDG